jgi:hypothetical protein
VVQSVVGQSLRLVMTQWVRHQSGYFSVLANFFVLSIFGQFDYELESRLLKSENRFHAQHLLPRALDKLTDDHVATIYK